MGGGGLGRKLKRSFLDAVNRSVSRHRQEGAERGELGSREKCSCRSIENKRASEQRTLLPAPLPSSPTQPSLSSFQSCSRAGFKKVYLQKCHVYVPKLSCRIEADGRCNRIAKIVSLPGKECHPSHPNAPIIEHPIRGSTHDAYVTAPRNYFLGVARNDSTRR